MTRFRLLIAFAICYLALAYSPLPSVAQGGSSSSSPVLVLSGAGTCCGGATTETSIASLRVPANSMGTNGAIDVKCHWTYPNSANNKTLLVRFGTAVGVSGTSFATTVATTTISTSYEAIIRNTATNVQVAYGAAVTAPYGTTTNANGSGAIDTTADAFLNFNAVTASGAETITLNGCTALVMRAP